MKLKERPLSKATIRKREIVKRTANILNNNKYDTLINLQESEDLLMQETNMMSNSFSSKFKRRKLIQERSNYKSELEKKLFTESIFTVFYDALVLDESFKEKYEEKLFVLFEKTLYQYMEDTNSSLKTIKFKNGLLEDLITLCEDIAKDETSKKFSNDDILNELDKEEDFEIGEESTERINDESDYVSSQVTERIKSRVLETIEKEQRIANDKKDFDEEIKTFTSDLNGDEDTPEVTSAGEMDGNVDNDPNSYDEENMDEKPELEPNSDKSAPATKAIVEESITFKELILTKPLKINKTKKLQENTFFGSLLKATANKAIKENQLNESIEVNMDLVFSEAVTMLTMFETMQTVGITNFKPYELREFGKKLVADSFNQNQ